MIRLFCNLSLSKHRWRTFSTSYLSSQPLPRNRARAAKHKLKFRLSSPIPLEELLASNRRSPVANAPSFHPPSYVSEPNNFSHPLPFHSGDPESLHLRLIKIPSPQHLFLSNHLVNMYVKIGCLQSAHQMFDEMPERNVVSWTSLISGYCHQGLAQKAFHLFNSMLSAGPSPTNFTFSILLQACRDSGPPMLSPGTQTHAMVTKSAFSLDVGVSNSLISMYGSCCIAPARYADDAFYCTPIKDTVTWNSIISVHTQNRDTASAFAFFSKMQEEANSCIKPNESTFGSLIGVSYASSSPYLIEQMLGRVLKNGFLCDLYVGSAMVYAFSRYGEFDTAREVFRELSEKNTVSVNGLMTGLVKQNHGEEALEVFKEAGNLVSRDCHSYVLLLNAVTKFALLDEGRRRGSELHGHVIRTGLIDSKGVYNGLVNMYSKFGDIEKALAVFKWIGLTQNGLFEKELTCFSGMLRKRIFQSNFAMVSLLSSCSSSRFLRMGSQLHCLATKVGLDSDTSVLNSLISMYGDCDSVLEARKIFDSMPGYNQVSWNSMLGVLASSEAPLEELLVLFLDMMRCGWRPNTTTFMNLLPVLTSRFDIELGKQLHALAENCGISEDTLMEISFLHMYANLGDIKSCEGLFAGICRRSDIVPWNTMVSGYVRNGLLPKAMDLVWIMMHNGAKMDCFTFASVLSACSSVTALERGMETHAFGIRSRLIPDVVAESALVDMYSKCGRIDNAAKVFDGMASKNEHSWNAMILGYVRHGEATKALELFKTMRDGSGLRPDHVTFIAVLSACSCTCLVEEGLGHFRSMKEKYGLVPGIEHYSCVVDLLGRAGEIKKMAEFVEGMPIAPDNVIWRTVLEACWRSQNGKNMSLYKKASEIVVELEAARDGGNYALMSSLYVASSTGAALKIEHCGLR